MKLICSDAMYLTSLIGITHVYAFDIGNSPILTNHFMDLFLRSHTTTTVVSHYCMKDYDDVLDRIKLPFPNKIAGSGEQKSIYLYTKKNLNLLSSMGPSSLSPCPLIQKCLGQHFLEVENDVLAILN